MTSGKLARLAAVPTVLFALAALGCSDSRGTSPLALASSKSGGSATIWAVGDGANGSAAGRAVAERVVRAKPARFLYLGDVYNEGRAAEFATNYRYTYGRLAKLTAPTPGNHDWPLRTEGYNAYWGAAMGKAVPPWYRFSVGGWELFSLNSEAPHDGSSPQLRWLRSKLRSAGTCRLAFWHRPRYSAGQHGDAPDVAPLWNAVRGRVSIVLTGHEHNMQRHKRRDGIIQLISGAGGHSHYPLNHRDRRLAFWNSRHYGALRLDLRPGLADYAFVAANGRTLDAGRVRCRVSSEQGRAT